MYYVSPANRRRIEENMLYVMRTLIFFHFRTWYLLVSCLSRVSCCLLSFRFAIVVVVGWLLRRLSLKKLVTPQKYICTHIPNICIPYTCMRYAKKHTHKHTRNVSTVGARLDAALRLHLDRTWAWFAPGWFIGAAQEEEDEEVNADKAEENAPARWLNVL